MSALLEVTPMSQELSHMLEEQVRKTLKYVLAHSKDKEWTIKQADLDKIDKQFDLNFKFNDGGSDREPVVFVAAKPTSGHANRRRVSVDAQDGKKSISIAKPKKRVLTPEQRERERERKRKYRARKKAASKKR